MEQAVRSPRIKSAITRLETTRFWPLRLPKFPAADRHWPSKPRRGERNFWMQRREAKIGLRDHKRHRRPKERNDTGENPLRNGLSRVGAGICGFVGLDGGHHLDQTGCSPRSHRTGLRNSSQERNFLLQRPRGELASFGSIAGAETALTREFGRHAFEVAALLRVSHTQYNFRVWVVGAPGLEPGTR
jgi:hypothetical protein